MHPRFTLRQLAYFVAVAETGSISAAAVNQHVSESAISTALTELERALGSQLCVRRRARGVELTASGRHLVGRAADLLRDAAALSSLAEDPVSGTVSLGCTSGLAPLLLPPIVDACATELSSVRLDLDLRDTQALLAELDSGAVDLAVVSNLQLLADVSTHVLLPTPLHVVLHADHRLADAPEVDLRELATEPFILLETSPGAHHALETFARAGVTPDIRYRTTSFELVRSLVGRGLGYSLQVLRPHGDLTYEGLPLAPRPVALPSAGEAVVLAWTPRRRLSPAARAVADLAVREWRQRAD
ncbi:LysR family transcriptional regulator [Pseudonocardia lutea]|uniref:LysR family transcriptional regulator n=1 Tax=Pseudonocardia lutea TaxID=2172015 RepID=A0ABW1HZH5_9PSEU